MSLTTDRDMVKSIESKKKSFGSKELPDKMADRKTLRSGEKQGVVDLTASQYYASVKGNRMPKNVGNILQLGTPSGANAQGASKTVQVPVFSEPDGAIDPNRIRSITDPNSAQPYDFEGAYGLEGGVKFAIPKTAKTSSNSVNLLRQAQMSYQNRQQILTPRQPQGTPDQSIQQGVMGGGTKPPSYDESVRDPSQTMGNLTPYKDNKTDSELNEDYS